MPRQEISAPGAPAAIGPYSQAIAIDGFLFCSGQLGLDPATGQLLDGIANQAERAMVNLESVLAAAGVSLADVVKTTIFLADLADFSTVNDSTPTTSSSRRRPAAPCRWPPCRGAPWSRSRRSHAAPVDLRLRLPAPRHLARWRVPCYRPMP